MKHLLYPLVFLFLGVLTSCSNTLSMAYEDDLYADEENIYLSKKTKTNEADDITDDYFDPNYEDVYENDYYLDKNTGNTNYYGSPSVSLYSNYYMPSFGSYNAWGTPYSYSPFGYSGYYGLYSPYQSPYIGWGTSYLGNSWGNYNNWMYNGYNPYGYNSYGYNPYYGTYNPYNNYYNYNGYNSGFVSNDTPYGSQQHRGRGISSSSKIGGSTRPVTNPSNSSSSTTNTGTDSPYAHVVPSGLAVNNNNSVYASAKSKRSTTTSASSFRGSLSAISEVEKRESDNRRNYNYSSPSVSNGSYSTASTTSNRSSAWSNRPARKQTNTATSYSAHSTSTTRPTYRPSSSTSVSRAPRTSYSSASRGSSSTYGTRPASTPARRGSSSGTSQRIGGRR